MATATTFSLHLEAQTWTTDRLTDEALQAIASCRKHGQTAAKHALKAGGYLSILHARLVKRRQWASWLRKHEDVISQDTARRYILLHERTGGRVSALDGMTLTEAYAAFGITRFTEIAPQEPTRSGSIHLPERLDADLRRLPTPPLNGTHGSNGTPHPVVTTDVEESEDSLADLDEEAILRAAAQIRQRRVAEQLRQAQERRRQATPSPLKRRKGSPVLHGDCLDLIPTLEDGSVGLVVTSPPYAEQRKVHYGGVPELAYPEFTVQWMEALRPKLKDDSSVLIVIRPHLRDGVISDYVLRTRLALRDAGWNECEELIWAKPDAPPLGSLRRPRRTWESVLWYSRSPDPYCDLKACGRESARLGFEGSLRFGVGGQSPLNGGQGVGRTDGVARIGDVLVAPVGENEPGIDHPAVFPLALAEQLIRTFSTEDDLVLDPFCGSGQTLLAAKGCGRRYLGIEREAKYVGIVAARLR